MSETNTGWRLLLLDASAPSLAVESNPITLELVSPGPQGPSGAAAAVTSVNGQTGAVVLTAASVGAAAAAHGHAIADVSGLQTALDGKAPTVHTHGVGDVTGLGTAATRNVPATGNAAASEAVLGSDTRLTNPRTPTAHASSHSTLGDDPIDALSIGAAPSVHTHGNLTSDGRLGTTAGRPVITGTGGAVTVGNFGTNAGQYCEGNDSRLSNARTPTGTAGGDLQGTYPDPEVHKIHGVNMQSGTPTDGDLWQYHDANTRWRHRTFINVLDDNGIGWDGAFLTVDGVVLENGEFIRNTVNGRIDFMPAPHPSGDYGVYFDLTTNANYALVGTIDSTGALNTNAGFQFSNNLAVVASKNLDFGNTGGLVSYYAQAGGNGAWYFAPYIGSGNAGALCLVSQNGMGNANRRPATAHANPTIYVYAGGFANANDFVRTSHDGTDGAVEAGRGKLRRPLVQDQE